VVGGFAPRAPTLVELDAPAALVVLHQRQAGRETRGRCGPRKPVTGRSVRPPAISSRAIASGNVLPAFAFPDHEATSGIVARTSRSSPCGFSMMS